MAKSDTEHRLIAAVLTAGSGDATSEQLLKRYREVLEGLPLLEATMQKDREEAIAQAKAQKKADREQAKSLKRTQKVKTKKKPD